jgi:mono/diheme cytochrome c family protein
MKSKMRMKQPASLLLTLASLLSAGMVHADNAGAHAPGVLQTRDGGQVYRQICQGCHMPDGRGASGAGHYPALAGNPTVASSRYMALTILQGRRNMPSFEPRPSDEAFFVPASLTDQQVAAVINYVRTHFGNHYRDAISTAEVQALHQASR